MKEPRSKKTLQRDDGKADATPFELWLNRGLHRIYDDVASEPVPDELLKLIEDDRTNRQD